MNWDAAAIAKLREFRGQHLSYAAMAAQFGCTTKAVEQACYRLRVEAVRRDVGGAITREQIVILPRHITPEWPRDLLERFVDLWFQKEPQLSTAKIGSLLGIGKNSVVSKAHRMSLPARPSPIKGRAIGGGRESVVRLAALPQREIAAETGLSRNTVAKHLATAGITRRAPMPPAMRSAPPPLSAVHTCQWPTSDGRPWTFCDAPVEQRLVCDDLGERWVPTSWCEEHAAIVWGRRAA